MSPPATRSQIPDNFDHILKRLFLDLKEADRSLTSARLPQRTLEELSETIDHLRATTWAVLNSVVDDFSDVEQAPTLLTAHRLQRTCALLLALNAEMDSRQLTGSTPGADQLAAALGATYKKLHFILHGKPAPVDLD